MFHKFRITAESINETRSYSVNRDKEMILIDIENELENDEWYQIKYHKCNHDIPEPCKDETIVAEKGEIPEEE